MSVDGSGLGRAIAAAREERGWKRKDLVHAAKISYPFLAEVENGNKQPSMAKLNDIAAALEMTPGALMDRARGIDERFGGESGALTGLDTGERPAAPYLSGDVGSGSREVRTEVHVITSAVMSALEPRLRELVELEVRRHLDRQRGPAW